MTTTTPGAVRQSTHAAAPAHPLAAAMQMLDQPFQKHSAAPLYLVNLAVVSVVMLILPLVYVAIVAAVGYVLYLHVTGQLIDFGEIDNLKALFVAFAGPLVIGGLLLLFMIKPLFAPAPRRGANLALRREENRTLFEFVARLCRMIGAPEPREIRVDCQANASASFRRGMLSFFGSDLTLTIGLPLVVGLNLRQFTGVLAHEFGHFAQGAGMRLTYIIRSISFWFMRVVYERDAWDERLVNWTQQSPHALITLMIWLSRLMIWATRRVLWVLMWIGQLVSGFMLRQMEYDADRYETRISGSAAFAQTARMLPLLGLATSETVDDLRRGWDEKRLCDDFLAVVKWNLKILPEATRRKVLEHVNGQKTGFFDSHPSDTDRIRAAAAQAEPGLFTDEQSPAVLFDNFKGLCRLATMAFYQDVLGEAFDRRYLVPAARFCQGQDAQIERNRALRRFLQVRIPAGRPLWLSGTLHPSADNAMAAEVIITARDRMLTAASQFAETEKKLTDADDRLVKATLANALRQAGITKFKPAEFGLRSAAPAEVGSALTASRQDRTDAGIALDELHEVSRFRLDAAIEVALCEEFAPELAKLNITPAHIHNLLAAMDALRRAHPDLMRLRDEVAALGVLLRALQPENNAEAHIKKILDYGGQCATTLRELRKALSVTAYPFEHTVAGASIALFVAETLPPAQEVGSVYEAGDTAIEKLLTLYYRILADLAHLAERVEAWLGLPPLPDPAETSEPG